MLAARRRFSHVLLLVLLAYDFRPSRMMMAAAATTNPRAARLVLVTGANRGIGKEVSKQLAEMGGYTILMGSRSKEKGMAAAEELGFSNIRAIELDVTNQATIQKTRTLIEEQYGGTLDILINNAGINYDSWQSVLNTDIDNVRETLETNLYGPWLCTMELLPLLRKSDHAVIVNVSSGSGALKGGNMSSETPAYGISKTALNALTIKLSKALPDMRVNAVCPGWIATDMGGSGGGPIEQGGASVVWAATLPKNGPTGGFFRNGKPVEW